jgi:hypothetical protein
LFNQQQQPFGAPNTSANLDEITRQKYLEEEKERLRQFEQRRQQGSGGAVFNPFASSQPVAPPQPIQQQQQPDLVNFFDAPGPTQAAPQAAVNNPFAGFGAPAPVQTQAPGNSVLSL